MSYGTKTNGGYGDEPCGVAKSPSQYDANVEEIFYQLERAEKQLTTLSDRIYKVLLPDYDGGCISEKACTPSPVNAPLIELLQAGAVRVSLNNHKLSGIIDRVQL
jgi:hypothetical protein